MRGCYEGPENTSAVGVDVDRCGEQQHEDILVCVETLCSEDTSAVLVDAAKSDVLQPEDLSVHTRAQNMCSVVNIHHVDEEIITGADVCEISVVNVKTTPNGEPESSSIADNPSEDCRLKSEISCCSVNSVKTSSGDEYEDSSAAEKYCLFCWKKCPEKVKRCKKCNSGCYCSRECRDSHVKTEYHQNLCIPIQQLSEFEKDKRVCSVRETAQVKQKHKLIRLIGEKALVNCYLGGKASKALWDTGAMVSMIDQAWLNKHFPGVKMMDIAEFLEGDELHLYSANNSLLKVQGVVILEFGLGEVSVRVPFIVTGEQLDCPLIGYNVIKHLAGLDRETLPTALLKSMPSLTQNKAKAVVNLIAADSPQAREAKVLSKVVLPPHSRCKIRCRTSFRTDEPKQNLLFSPNILDSELEFVESVVEVKRGNPNVNIVVSNPTNKPYVLKKGLSVGGVEAVSAVIPVMPSKSKKLSAEVNKVEVEPPGGSGTVNVESPENVDQKWLPNVDLSHLSDEQRAIAEEMLREECEVFCQNKDDQGDVPEMQMEIKLTDEEPVVVAHRQIPRPLYDEVKNFINDLVVNNWVRESKSAYSSPIVCVRKKDQSLRLCIDYRALNKKIVPDKHPIPRIQEILDGLGGQSWFSTLDMAKAYHQGYVKEECRRFTAFSTPWALYEWIRIPMGISNAPPVFQRFINQVLTGLRDKVCVAYLDDVLVYAKSFESHVHNLRLVLRRLKSKGVKLRADKCFLFREEVRYLGRLVSRNGHRPDPADSQALEKFRTPPNVRFKSAVYHPPSGQGQGYHIISLHGPREYHIHFRPWGRDYHLVARPWGGDIT